MKRETKINIFVFMLIMILTFAVTYPGIVEIGTKLLGIKDSYFYAWDLWWFEHALLSLHQSPLKLTTLFYPITGIPYLWSSPLNEIAGIIFLPILPLPVLFNFLALLPIVLGTYFTYKLVHHLTGQRLAGIAGGILFGFSPYLLSTMMGNLQYASVEFIPLVMYTMFRLKDDRTTKNGIMFIAASVLLAMSNSSYIFYAYLPMITYLPFSWLLKDRKAVLSSFFILYLLLSLGFVTLTALIFYIPQLDVTMHSEYAKALGTTQLLVNTQNFLDYFLPNKSNFLFKNILYFYSKDQTYFSNIGIVTLFLIVLVIAFKYERREVIRWGILAGVLYIFSLGTYLKFNGPVLYPYYGMMHFVSLPYTLLSNLRFLSDLTQPALLIPLLLLSTSIIAGFGIKLIIERTDIRSLSYITVFSLIFLALLEYYPGYPFKGVQATVPAYYMPIAKDMSTKAVIELPATGSVFGNKDNIPFVYRSMYYQIFTGKALVGGYYDYRWDRAQSFVTTTPFLSQLNDAFTLVYGDIIPVHKTVLADHGVRTLMDLGVRYIIVNRLAYDPVEYSALRSFLISYCGQPTYDDGYVSIFVLTRAYLSVNPGELLELGSGWYKPMLNEKEKAIFRMMDQDGTINITGVQHQRTVKLLLGILRPFKSIKMLDVSVNGKVINRIDLDATAQPAIGWESKPFTLEKGDNVITIHSMEEPIDPHKEFGLLIQDARPETIGIFGLKLSDTTSVH